MTSTGVRCEPFLLPAAAGYRFCIYYRPEAPCYANVLHVHAFAEELNKSRRTVAMQARSFAARGIGVLLMDLYGCGDSSGDFVLARWDIWQDDVAHAVRWLDRKAGVPIGLWGLRLGVPLMLSYAQTGDQPIESFLMWQPVVNGEVHLAQFLRLRLTGELLAGAASRTGTRELKLALKEGQNLEIAGYELAPALAEAIETSRLANLGVSGSTVHWCEVTSGDTAAVLPASRSVLEAWQRRGIDIHSQAVAAEPFWATQEIVECTPLIEATNRMLSMAPA